MSRACGCVMGRVQGEGFEADERGCISGGAFLRELFQHDLDGLARMMEVVSTYQVRAMMCLVGPHHHSTSPVV